MSTSDTHDPWTSMTIRRSTYRQVKACKRGGESFNELLAAMSAYYDPDDAETADTEHPRKRGDSRE